MPDDENPYEPPRAPALPPDPPELDGFYRLRQFLLMVTPAILGGAIGSFIQRRLFLPYFEVGLAAGALVGLLVGLVLRVALRRR